MGQVKKLLILLGKPGYWLAVYIIRLILFITKILGDLKIKFAKTRPPKQITLPFPKRKINKKTLALVLIIVGMFLVLAGTLVNLFEDLPEPDQLVERPSPLTTKIYDRNGELLFKIFREENRTLVTLDKIPDHMIKATLAIEDKNFFVHNGLSWRGIFRAVRHNILNPDQTLMGGSTITQQLIKNSLLTPEKTWRRKVQEAILSIWAEKVFTKDEILQMYFNEIPYGGTAYGVEAASQKYFNKHVWELNSAETSLLAGLTRAPSDFSPFGSYPEKAKQRQKQVITEMIKAGFITKKEAEKIILDRLRFNLEKETIKAPHFVFYVKDWLIENFGKDMVEKGGLQVKTTLDWSTQQKVQSIVKNEVDSSTNLNVTNGAALVINPKKGEIKAMVGSKDYFDFKNDGNVNVTLRPRQPGSAIKPINYAVALQKGYTAATILSDTPITYRLPGQKPYSPVNYDGKFRGQISLRTALGSSLNVPATKVLSSYGVDQMIEMGEKMGITTWEEKSRFGLALTLGGGEVKMIDLAQAYATLANLGKKVNLNPILEIKNQKNEIIYQHPCINTENCSEKVVLNPGIAFIINDILSDNQARELAFGSNSLLKIADRKVAVKTGTTNNLRDNWAIGYTPNIVVSAWVGNNDNSPMSRIASGITGATPIWRKITNTLMENETLSNWEKPGNVIQTTICRTTGTLPCVGCPQIVDEYFLKGTEPSEHCSLEPSPPPLE